MFDPRQYAKAPKRTLTAELITGRSKQTLDIAKIMSGMNDTHMKVTPTGDMKTKPRGTSNVKHGVRIVRTPGTPAAKPTRDPRRPRITVPTPKPIPPVASTRGISKRRIIFLPSRATTIKNPPLAISQESTDEIHDRDLTEPCETWLDNTPSTAEAGKTTNTETETEKEIKKRNCHPLQIPSSSDNVHYKVKVRINYRIIYFKSASAAYNASSDDVHYKVKARIINRLIYFKPASTVKVNKTQVNYQTTAYKNGPQMNYAKIASSVFKVKVKTNFTLTSDPAGSHTNYFKKLARTNISKLNILNSIVPLQQPLFADQYRTPTARHTATRNDPDAQARSTSNRDEYSSPTPHCTPTARQAANSKVTNGKDRPTPNNSQADKFHNPTPTNATKEKTNSSTPTPFSATEGNTNHSTKDLSAVSADLTTVKFFTNKATCNDKVFCDVPYSATTYKKYANHDNSLHNIILSPSINTLPQTFLPYSNLYATSATPRPRPRPNSSGRNCNWSPCLNTLRQPRYHASSIQTLQLQTRPSL